MLFYQVAFYQVSAPENATYQRRLDTTFQLASKCNRMHSGSTAATTNNEDARGRLGRQRARKSAVFWDLSAALPPSFARKSGSNPPHAENIRLVKDAQKQVLEMSSLGPSVTTTQAEMDRVTSWRTTQTNLRLSFK